MDRRRLQLVSSIVCLGLLLVLSTPATAQITGQIRGQVVDQEGNPLPGVTFVLTGQALPGAQRTAVSGEGGGFLFGSLPVGSYTVSASLDGFRSQTVEGVRVNIDGVASLTFKMQMESFTEEMKVTGTAPIVDVASASVTTSYDEEFVVDLPTRGNFYDIMALAPAMSAPSEGSAAFTGYGGNVTSQQWNIDGLNLAAPEGGWLSINLNPSVIAETQLMGVGAGAEYGNTMGNVYNVVTKSGTKEFRGGLDFYYRSQNLTGSNVNLDTQDLPDYRLNDPGGKFMTDHYYDARATLGGPVVRDKVWFFAGIQYYDETATGPNNVADLPGTGIKTDRYDLKLTSQVTENQRLDVRGHYQTSDTVPAPDMYTALSNVMVTDLKTDLITVDYNAMVSANDLLNVRAGAWTSKRDMASRTGSTEEWFLDDLDVGPALNKGGVFWFKDRKEEYTQADVTLSHYADQFLGGQHEFKFGVQYTAGEARRTVGNSSFWWRQPAKYFKYYAFRWRVDPFIYGANVESLSGFISDSWKIGKRLTVDVGVRYDHQKGRIPDFPKLDVDGNPTGETIPGADMIDWKNWAPRIGFAWQPRGDGRTVVRGAIGLFWDGPVSSAWYYPAPGRGPLELFWVYPAWGQIYSQPTAPANELLDPNVKNPYTWQYSLAVEHQLGQDYAIGLQLTHKDTDDIIGWQIMDDGVYQPFTWTDPFTGQQLELVDVITQPTRRKGNGPGPGSLAPDANYYIDYRGAVLTFKKRYSDGWDLMASYTYSKTEGINSRPHDNGSLGQGLPGFTTDSGSDPNDWVNAKHLLQGDRTHMFRVQSNVDVGWGVRLGGVLNIQSGRPYLRLAQVVAPSGSAITITADASDGLRLPTQKIFDLGLQKTFALGGGVDLSVGVQVLNVFNEDAVEYYSTWTLYEGEDFTPSGWVNPRRGQIRLKLEF